MNPAYQVNHEQGINLRQAALVAGLGLLIMTIAAPFAEFFVYAKLVVAGNVEATAQNIRAQGGLQLNAFRYEWGFGLILFGIHLLLLGWLVYRAAYIPKTLGILLAIAGLGWVAYELSPFLAPGADVGFLMITFMGETVFMLWLLVRGWKIPPH